VVRKPLLKAQEHAEVARVYARKDGSGMNPYAIVGSGIGTAGAASFRARLMAWQE